MQRIYIGCSYIENETAANQIQTKKTFLALQKIDPQIKGIFLGNRRSWGAKIRTHGNSFFIDIRTWYAFILHRFEKITKISFFRKVWLGRSFARAAGKILKTNPDSVVYVRQGSIGEFITYLENLDRFKINRLIFELHDLEFAIPGFFNYDFEFKRCEQLFKKFFSLILKYADRVKLVTLTKTLAEIIQDKYKFNEPIAVIPDSHDFYEVSRKTVDFTKKRIELIYTGLNLGPNKGVDYLIRSLEFLEDTFYLTLIGGSTNDRDRLRKEYKNFIDQKRLHIVSSQPHEQIQKLLAQADIAIVPLPKGGFSDFTSPLKLFEYMSVGLPIIASDIPALREIVTNNKNALLFEAGNSRDLAEKIRYLGEHPEIAYTISRQAQEDSKRYSYEKRAKKILNLLD